MGKSRNQTSKEAMERRRRAREQALQLLFASEFATQGSDVPLYAADAMDGIVLEQYALDAYNGIAANQQQIDDVIAGASQNWALSRMPRTDRSILRLAVYELLFCDDVPVGASINEAVELAQSFGGEDDSYRFVNGVLGKIAKQLENGFTPMQLWEMTNPGAFDTLSTAEAEGEEPAAEPVVDEPASDDGFDYGEFSFDEMDVSEKPAAEKLDLSISAEQAAEEMAAAIAMELGMDAPAPAEDAGDGDATDDSNATYDGGFNVFGDDLI